MFSIFQYMNTHLDYPENQCKLTQARLLLRRCVQVAEYQLQNGGHLYIEQPQSTSLWKEPEMVKLMDRDDV